MHAQIGFLDGNVRPDQIDQLWRTHNLSRSVGQSDQNVESAAADGDRRIIPDEQSLRTRQAEGAERHDVTDGWFTATCRGKTG